MPDTDKRLWNRNSEEFVDRMTTLFLHIMGDYEPCDGGMSREDVVKEFNECMGISWPWEWVKGYYRPTREWKWIEAIE